MSPIRYRLNHFVRAHPKTFTSSSFAVLLDNKLFILSLFPLNPTTSPFFGNIIAFCISTCLLAFQRTFSFQNQRKRFFKLKYKINASFLNKNNESYSKIYCPLTDFILYLCIRKDKFMIEFCFDNFISLNP